MPYQKELQDRIVEYGQKEIYSPNKKYIALLRDDVPNYVVCLVDVWEDGKEHIDTDYSIGEITTSLSSSGFYILSNVENSKIDLIELHQLVLLCVNGYY